MFTFDRLRQALITGAIFFACLWIVQDLWNGAVGERLAKNGIMAFGFAILDLTFGQWWRRKWMARLPALVRKKIAERTK